MPDFQFVAASQTADLLAELAGQDCIGLDTEFMREKTYFAELCLVQLSLGNSLYCVDPLAGEVSPAFWQAVLRPGWVLHSGRQDFEVIFQAAGALPGSVFDTQVAAALLGYPPQVGYGKLVEELFQVQLAKSHTRTDWSRRPLPQGAIDYAAEDVEYLLPAREVLGERLDRLGRLEWALQDSADLLDTDLYRSDPEEAILRIKGARALRGPARRAATLLATWREREALRCNKPRQWILRDKALLDIATARPLVLTSLDRISELPAATSRRIAKELPELFAIPADADDGYEPPDRADEQQKALMKRLHKKVSHCATALGIAGEIIAPRKELSALIVGERNVRVLRGWRREQIGDELLRLLSA